MLKIKNYLTTEQNFGHLRKTLTNFNIISDKINKITNCLVRKLQHADFRNIQEHLRYSLLRFSEELIESTIACSQEL